MDHQKNLFDIVAEGDDITLQRLLLEGKEERNVATLAVSDHDMRSCLTSITNSLLFLISIAWKYFVT